MGHQRVRRVDGGTVVAARGLAGRAWAAVATGGTEAGAAKEPVV